MNSRAFFGELTHVRHAPTAHRFRYPVHLYAFDLDELDALGRRYPWFGHNRVRPLALHDRDYLDGGPGTLREKLARLFARANSVMPAGRVELVTNARWFNHAFNPVSFFWCHDTEGAPRAIVAEVNNTFGERHTYVLDDLVESGTGWEPRADVPKVFHVSPFNAVRGVYRFRFGDPTRGVDVAIQLIEDGVPTLSARLTGTQRDLDGRCFAHVLVRQPLSVALTLPRIAFQAARLKWQRRLVVHPLPAVSSLLTMRVAQPSPLERACRALVMRAVRRIERGQLEIVMPDGRAETVGDRAAVALRLEVRHPRFFTRIVRDGDIGIGEAWTAGDIAAPDLPGVLALLALNRERIETESRVLAAPGRLLERVRHQMRANTRRGSSRNVVAHYDLGNEFFGLFLDPSMTYSAARFEAGDDLERAQERKLDRAMALGGLKAGQYVLEIGCGWGSFAIRAARQLGCRVTGVTLSPRQLEVARERAERAGVTRLVNFELCDYRALRGRYDAVVSIEMIEAVGHEYLAGFFEKLDSLLAPRGRAVLQAITIADTRYADYRRRPDWIQKHVFPGGVVPSLAVLRLAMAARTRLGIERLERFGPDYARTCREWRERFEAAAPEAERLGYAPEFRRAWHYYLSYCEAGFETGAIDVCQMVLGRAGDNSGARVIPVAV